jgi:hypothetical protein
MNKLKIVFLAVSCLLLIQSALRANQEEFPLGPPLNKEIIETLSIPLTMEQLFDFLSQLQLAAEAGHVEGLRTMLARESFEKLEKVGLPLEKKMSILREIKHPARFVQVIRIGEERVVEGKACVQIILPREGRYKYMDGVVPEPYRYRQIDLWTCLSVEEGQLKASFAYPFNALICLTQ